LTLIVHWLDHKREPQCKPNPDYPEGVDVDISDGAARTCSTPLLYPAKRCGVYIVRCDLCGHTAGITTAGRPDDPRSVKLPCKETKP
jgi:hypothetical protein